MVKCNAPSYAFLNLLECEIMRCKNLADFELICNALPHSQKDESHVSGNCPWRWKIEVRAASFHQSFESLIVNSFEGSAALS